MNFLIRLLLYQLCSLVIHVVKKQYVYKIHVIEMRMLRWISEKNKIEYEMRNFA